MFNLTDEQIKKLSGGKDDKCDYNNPICQNETLEPCLRGADKILNDSNKKEMMHRIYRRVRNSGPVE